MVLLLLLLQASCHEVNRAVLQLPLAAKAAAAAAHTAAKRSRHTACQMQLRNIALLLLLQLGRAR
jgi:hypothetical protein